ncbi:type VI secretion system-associated protein TagO [Bradyrhizobium icense]|uniref:type VI secretion system-associated protein TagO n=1 Tax=Bradyrhizobium icense TaxID=1274631 RepID=UPI0009F33926|nr:type VI secretion system-associated protein TagO [Bradyrhizobium icense]
MRGSAAVAAAMLLGLSQAICAQVGTDNIFDRLKACSQFDGTERLECVDELLRTETPDSAVSHEPNWIISETTSPVDYSPQIVAVTKARSSSRDAPTSLAIRCRAGRTELTISTAGRQDGEVTVAYRINDEPTVEARWKPANNGRSLAFPGDVVRLLRSMPASGQMLIKVYAGRTSSNEGAFKLAGLDSVRRKIATMCNWPQPE